ncbi:MAG: argininosuccinate lyase [Magnetococcales bacterium]|nr:argininosuccinate lyase [Magnetococcales bacterium]MBF0150874.1 argininosuccinate lyase [Magnetococcales bacterium]MBF0172673.1 argininosuccinate lyase [Magnetococcales bacterium]MBF0348034.1 argininosuccinate lyase [Magnetococcales bacterium]MBF0629385.1 argininosuccinate lyase [Magnetococcales bacterium]
MTTARGAHGKLWGGRFREPTNAFVERFTASIHYDRRLFREDIRASSVHCRMLARQGIIPREDALKILEGLEQIKGELEAGTMTFRTALEDIHMHVEHRLTELIGPVAGKLHTARSRNDQVATDLRLYLRGEVDEMIQAILAVQHSLLDLAGHHVETILPGFTHLQNAQPVRLAHHLLAYFEMFGRDRERLVGLRPRLNQLPLGSAALAGTPFPVDREWVARELGFDGVCRNSMDAVSDRDFVLELAFAGSVIMGHLSRFSEELILWSSSTFGFIELPDAFCTGSSIMPQKKNPDVPELVRGKSGRVTGHLMALLMMMKGLPLAYNRDMQEDKEPIFDVVDTVTGSLRLFADLIPGLQIRKDKMAAAAAAGFTTATDLADYLVRKGVPFREAHEITGRIVRICVEEQQTLATLPLATMKQVDGRIEEDVHAVLQVEASVNARRSPGGTAFVEVQKALRTAFETLEK